MCEFADTTDAFRTRILMVEVVDTNVIDCICVSYESFYVLLHMNSFVFL